MSISGVEFRLSVICIAFLCCDSHGPEKKIPNSNRIVHAFETDVKWENMIKNRETRPLSNFKAFAQPVYLFFLSMNPL
mgnify:CR=1 FL=1